MMTPSLYVLLLVLHVALLLPAPVLSTQSGMYYDDNELGKTVRIDTLSKKQQRMIREEMLHVLGLEKEPRVRKDNLAPQYMIDLYKEFAVQDMQVNEATDKYTQQKNSKQPDLVISFTNHVRKHPYHGHARHDRSQLFYFDFTEVPATEDVCRADFRTYKMAAGRNHDNAEDSNFNLVLYRLVQDSSDQAPHLEVEANMSVSASYEGWLDFNISSAATRWTYFPNTNMGLFLEIHDQAGVEWSPRQAGVVGRRGPPDEQPFLVAYFRSSAPPPVRSRRHTTAPASEEDEMEASSSSRTRRQTNNEVSYIDNPMIKYEPKRKSCNKRALYVSFQDLKWQEWIISPKGYAASFCAGHCRFPLNARMNATNHAIVQTLLHTKRASIPEPCCAPTKLSPVSVLYFDERNNVILKNYQNMVVKACGCH